MSKFSSIHGDGVVLSKGGSVSEYKGGERHPIFSHEPLKPNEIFCLKIVDVRDVVPFVYVGVTSSNPGQWERKEMPPTTDIPQSWLMNTRNGATWIDGSQTVPCERWRKRFGQEHDLVAGDTIFIKHRHDNSLSISYDRIEFQHIFTDLPDKPLWVVLDQSVKRLEVIKSGKYVHYAPREVVPLDRTGKREIPAPKKATTRGRVPSPILDGDKADTSKISMAVMDTAQFPVNTHGSYVSECITVKPTKGQKAAFQNPVKVTLPFPERGDNVENVAVTLDENGWTTYDKVEMSADRAEITLPNPCEEATFAVASRPAQQIFKIAKRGIGKILCRAKPDVSIETEKEVFPDGTSLRLQIEDIDKLKPIDDMRDVKAVGPLVHIESSHRSGKPAILRVPLADISNGQKAKGLGKGQVKSISWSGAGGWRLSEVIGIESDNIVKVKADIPDGRTTFITYASAAKVVDPVLIAKYIDNALHLHSVVVVLSQRHDNSKDAAFKICHAHNARDEIEFMETLGYSAGPPRSTELLKLRDQQKVGLSFSEDSEVSFRGAHSRTLMFNCEMAGVSHTSFLLTTKVDDACGKKAKFCGELSIQPATHVKDATAVQTTMVLTVNEE